MITEYRRYEPPEVTVFADGVWQVDSRRYEEVVDPTLPSDIMMENRFEDRHLDFMGSVDPIAFQIPTMMIMLSLRGHTHLPVIMMTIRNLKWIRTTG